MNQGEPLWLRLLSLHNLRFTCDLARGARAAIEEGRFTAFKREFLEGLQWADS